MLSAGRGVIRPFFQISKQGGNLENSAKNNMTAQSIREAIQQKGGIESFPVSMKKNRPLGCPRKNNMRDDLQELSSQEIHLAFNLGLIGNINRTGSIIADAHSL